MLVKISQMEGRASWYWLAAFKFASPCLPMELLRPEMVRCYEFPVLRHYPESRPNSSIIQC